MSPQTGGVEQPTRRLPLHRLLVTRPEPEAQHWAHDLCAQGWPAQALPLLAITAPDDAPTQERLRHWRANWHTVHAVFFVSGAAATHFFNALPVWTDPTLPQTRFWAPGPGTAQTVAQCLAQRGLAGLAIDTPPPGAGQFDSEHLWPVVAAQAQAGHRVLLVRGASDVDTPGERSSVSAGWAGTGRDWLLNRCVQAGMDVAVCVAYRRGAPDWSAGQRDLAQAGLGENSLWLLSSSEAVRHWAHCWGGQAPHPASATAMVTHARIAEAAERLGFGHVVTVRPTLSDVLRRLESGWSPP